MASLGMQGPYDLSTSEIDVQITKVSEGNYALGYVNNNKKFIVQYVGRSDTDLNARLKQHASAGEYKNFKYAYATSPKAAFEKECQNFHDFGETEKLANRIHPDRPKNNNWKCPCCSIFD